MILFPAIFGAVTAVPLFFLTQEIFERRVALISTYIYVILPASIARTFAGFVEKESLAGITVFLWLYLFLRSTKDLDFSNNISFILPIFSGIFMGLSFLIWRGVAYFSLLLALSIFIWTLIRPDKKLVYSIVMTSFFGFALMYLIQPELYPYQSFFVDFRFAPLTLVTFLSIGVILFELFPMAFKKKFKPSNFIKLVLIALLFTIFFLVMQDRIIKILMSILTQLTGGTAKFAVEAQKAPLQSYTISSNPFSWFVFLLPIGIYYFVKDEIKNLNFPSFFILTWFVTASFGSYMIERLFFILAPVASILMAYGFFTFSDSLTQSKAEESTETTTNWKLYLLVGLFLILSLGTIMADISFAKDVKESQYERITQWENALIYVKINYCRSRWRNQKTDCCCRDFYLV
jgi:asparagine N-glycosylation enzyme membrane subunit Stt3